jgi:hypothetical protein
MSRQDYENDDQRFMALGQPFQENEIEWRIQQGGFSQNGEPWAKVLAYVDSRAIQTRLDDTFGPANWMNEIRPIEMAGKVAFIQRLSIRLQDGNWITKEDGAPTTDVEAWKGGISDALKRAAVLFGIGRYLYDLGTSWAVFVESKSKARYNSAIKDKSGKVEFRAWNPPELPREFLPSTAKVQTPKRPPDKEPVDEQPRQEQPKRQSDDQIAQDKQKVKFTNQELKAATEKEVSNAVAYHLSRLQMDKESSQNFSKTAFNKPSYTALSSDQKRHMLDVLQSAPSSDELMKAAAAMKKARLNAKAKDGARK